MWKHFLCGLDASFHHLPAFRFDWLDGFPRVVFDIPLANYVSHGESPYWIVVLCTHGHMEVRTKFRQNF